MASTTHVNGEGSVFWIESRKAWRASRTVENLLNEDGSYGRPVRVSGEGKTKEIALSRCDQNVLKWRVKHGADPIILRKAANLKTQTVAEYFEKWLPEKLKRDNIRDSTATYYRNNLRLHILPAIGEINLLLLSESDLIKLLDDLENKDKLSGGIRRGVYHLIKQALDDAVRRRVIPYNPILPIDPPKKTPPKVTSRVIRDWARNYAPKVWSWMEDTGMEARWILAFLGLRQSEALGVTLDCLDLFNEPYCLEVSQQLSQRHRRHGCGPWSQEKGWPCGKKTSETCPNPIGTHGVYLNHEVKTKKSNRVIPLVEPFAGPILLQAKKQLELRQSPGWNPQPGLEDLLFTHPDGQPIRHAMDNKAWRKLLEDANVPHVRGHVARHVAVSLLANRGVSDRDIELLTGHETRASLDVYRHQSLITLAPQLKKLASELGSSL